MISKLKLDFEIKLQEIKELKIENEYLKES